MQYLIYETQKRQDGVLNVVPTVARQSFTTAFSYYHDRIKTMVVNNDFVWVAVELKDEKLNTVKREFIDLVAYRQRVEAENKTIEEDEVTEE